MDIRHLTGRMDPIGPVRKPQENQPGQGPLAPNGRRFADLLEKATVEVPKLTFSGHALKRLEDRNINLTDADLVRLEEAVERAESKGSRESLILDGDHAFVVNIQNRMVITAVDQMELRDRVFTHIDSAVLTKK